MKTADILPRMYEDLANHFARQGESRRRDECLVLAADAALSAGLPEEAERLRKRLLLTNPHHLLRPYASMTEAMQASDVCDFVVDLRKQWPPAAVEKLLEPASASAPAKVPLAKPVKKSKPPTPEASADDTVTPANSFLALLLFALGLLVAGGLLLVTLGGQQQRQE